MTRCRQTDALLGATFAGTDLTRAQAEHVRGCAECARAMSQARRFENDLARVGLGLSPEPMPALADLAEAFPSLVPTEGRIMTSSQRLIGSAIALVALVAVVLGGGQWLRSLVDDEVASRTSAAPISAAAAAALVGVPQDEVLMTEDGALAIRDLGLRMELILVTSSADGLVANVMDSSPPGSARTLFSAITCAEDEQLERTDYVWGRWEEVSQVRGLGEFNVSDSNHLIFAYDPEPANPATPMEVFEGLNGYMNFGPAGDFGERPCLVAEMDEAAEPRLPADLRCSDWPHMVDAHFDITGALVDDRLLPAIRELQQLPLSATRDDLIAAASGSIDKWCQDPQAQQDLLSDVIESGYGTGD